MAISERPPRREAGNLGSASLAASNPSNTRPGRATRAAIQLPPAARRLQYLARRLHALGAKPLFHFLGEVERGEPLRAHLEAYARLPAAFIKAHGADRFAPSLHCTLHEKSGRRWVGLPAKPYTANDGGQSWAAIVDFRDKRTAARFQELATAAAVAAYERVRWAT